jgi:hypothetical protein
LVLLGSFDDIRLALQFAMNENDFQAQLTFISDCQRKLGQNARDAGFYLSHNAGLYLKIKSEDLESLNYDLLVDLGNKLNGDLAFLASGGHTIVMVDARVLIRDGLPTPLRRKFSTVLKHGPKAFTHPFALKLAESKCWTNGHAHQGYKALCGDGEGEWFIASGVFRFAHRDSGEKTDEVPDEKKVPWTDQERKGVDKFHEENSRIKFDTIHSR